MCNVKLFYFLRICYSCALFFHRLLVTSTPITHLDLSNLPPWWLSSQCLEIAPHQTHHWTDTTSKGKLLAITDGSATPLIAAPRESTQMASPGHGAHDLVKEEEKRQLPQAMYLTLSTHAMLLARLKSEVCCNLACR